MHIALQQENVLMICFCCAAVCGVVVLGFFEVRHRKRREQLLYKILPEKLSKLDFYADFFAKEGGHSVGSARVWADAEFLFVVKHKGDAVAVIGFRLSADTMYVYQLQGIRNKRLFGITLGPFLLEKAEIIARVLGKTFVQVQAAEQHTYYVPGEESHAYDKLSQHQARMHAIYDRSPEQLGYEPEYRGNRIVWRSKQLRKYLTYPRWVALQFVLFKRSLRAPRQYVPARSS